jgi:dienelactone hydrolase
MRLASLFAIIFLASSSCFSQSANLVRFASFALGVDLQAWYYRPINAASTTPTIVALHGCAGMLNRQGQPNERSQSYAQFLNQQGWSVLFVDSLTPRGLKTVCGNSTDTLPPSARVADVQAAVAWLAKRDDVDQSRIGILGWSHGGSVTLLANDLGVDYAVQPKAALAFYPGCGALTVPRRWQPARPILMQLGQDDDWTDPKPCQAFAQQFPERIAQDTYLESGHGFDSDAPRRAMVLHAGTKHQRIVHVGGNAQANAQARVRLVDFFQQHFQTSK